MAPKNEALTTDSYLHLPIAVVTKVDIGRLLREMEAIDGFLAQSAIRQPGTATKLPKTSRLFEETVEINKLNVLLEDDRKRLFDFLKEVKTSAPIIHISFSADPSPLFSQKLITWLRAELHPLVLLQIGIQPNMGAGCVVRTTNKYFDLSLRSRFKEKGTVLTQLLQGVTANG